MQQKHKDVDQKKQNIEKETPNQESTGAHIEEGVEDVVEEAQQAVAAARRPWYQSLRWGRILLVVYAILLALFALLAWWVFYHPVLAIDITITHEFQENQAPWLRDIMIAVSFIGNVSALSLGLIILAAVLLWLIDLRLEALMVVVVSAVSSILNWLIKYIVARPRPTSNLVDIIQRAGGNSFPSGHVMAYVAFWGLLFSFGIILFNSNHWWRTALLIVSGLFVVLVGPSRIYLGDHWATDVLGAYLIGGVLLGFALWIYLALKGKGVLAPKGKPVKHFLEKYLK
ncbi:MAG TPA: phosphatase PAP2 family protein [Ktedonobacteraceae bacterium]